MSNRIKNLRFSYDHLKGLPGKSLEPAPSIQTPGIFYAETHPTSVSNPALLLWSNEAANFLGIHSPLTPEEIQTAAQIFSGNQISPGCRPYATRYGGHQFGVWAGQLGDGRALTLGAVRNAQNQFYEVQLKGAGPTPYSRTADGRAVLRSSLREFLCSEAMHHLGIPTTRALCCVTTGDLVVRDLFYDGNPQPEPGAITTRLSPSFLRFGHYEILAAQEEHALLRTLVSQTITQLFPELLANPSRSHEESISDELIVRWFDEVSRRTAQLMVDWQRVGFVHGVMNTDNLSILGLTIDYGPYGWLDVYDPSWTPNTTDSERRRYRFENQPSIALWNLSRFGGALLPLFSDSKKAISKLEESLERFRTLFRESYLQMRASKLGLSKDSQLTELSKLIEHLDQLLVSSEVDMTLFYRLLYRKLAESPTQVSAADLFDAIRESFYLETLPADDEQSWISWMNHYLALWQSSPLHSDRLSEMKQSNPGFILRNYLVQEALEALALGDPAPLHQLMPALQNPYGDSSEKTLYFKRRPDWARDKAGCSALSCSS